MPDVENQEGIATSSTNIVFWEYIQYSENCPNNGLVRLMGGPRHKSEFYVLEIPSSSSINDIGSFCQRKGKYWLLIIEICFNFGKSSKPFNSLELEMCNSSEIIYRVGVFSSWAKVAKSWPENENKIWNIKSQNFFGWNPPKLKTPYKILRGQMRLI